MRTASRQRRLLTTRSSAAATSPTTISIASAAAAAAAVAHARQGVSILRTYVYICSGGGTAAPLGIGGRTVRIYLEYSAVRRRVESGSWLVTPPTR
jgi:hypothetical protein